MADDSFYTDDNGKYVLADSPTGQTLLADTATYKALASTEDLRGEVGADTATPFSKKPEYVTLSIMLSRGAVVSNNLEAVGSKDWGYIVKVKESYIPFKKVYSISIDTMGYWQGLYVRATSVEGDKLVKLSVDNTHVSNWGQMYGTITLCGN